jgi:hypothetical protein
VEGWRDGGRHGKRGQSVSSLNQLKKGKESDEYCIKEEMREKSRGRRKAGRLERKRMRAGHVDTWCYVFLTRNRMSPHYLHSNHCHEKEHINKKKEQKHTQQHSTEKRDKGGVGWGKLFDEHET